MSETDSRGLALSTSSARAAQSYRDGVTLMLAGWPGASKRFDDALEADPDFALARAARARLHAMTLETAEARRQISLAATLCDRRGTEREVSHVGVIHALVEGQSSKALSLALEHADRWPRDSIIFTLPLGAFGLLAFSGEPTYGQARVDFCARYADQFSADDWWFLTYQGFSLAENGAVSRGRELLERAMGLRRENAHGVHALVHALHEAGDLEGAETLIDAWLPCYEREGVLHGHLVWHAALGAMERGDAEGALSRCREAVMPSVSRAMAINIVTDCASLLWRAQISGHVVSPSLWTEAAAFARRAFPSPGHGFIEPHMAFLLAACGERAELEERLKIMDRMVQRDELPAGRVVPVIARSVLAFAEGRYEDCASHLLPVMPDVVRIGGSNAQREVIEDTLIVALMKAGRIELARNRIQRRLTRRPSLRDRLG